MSPERKTLPKTDEEWAKVLTPEQFRMLREKGTELAGTGKLLHEKRTGLYRCAACGNPLFLSSAKYDSKTGWPSFDQALPGAVKFQPDVGLFGLARTEVICAKCSSHLGHVFDDGPTETTGKRFCMNSACLEFQQKEDKTK